MSIGNYYTLHRMLRTWHGHVVAGNVHSNLRAICSHYGLLCGCRPVERERERDRETERESEGERASE